MNTSNKNTKTYKDDMPLYSSSHMGKKTILQKIKNLVYKLVLPIFLWSIGFKTLDDYITAIEIENKSFEEFLFKWLDAFERENIKYKRVVKDFNKWAKNCPTQSN